MAQTFEVDETQYAALAKLPEYKAVFDSVTAMMANPKARRKILEARKEFDPNAVIPELDAAAPVNEAVTKLTDEMAGLRKELAEEKTARSEAERIAKLNTQWEKGRAKLRDAGWEDEGINKIEELMEKEGIANHEAGAAYFEKLNPPPAPVSPTNARVTIFDAPSSDEAMKMLHEGNEEGFLNQTINKTLADIRSGKR